MKHSVRRRITFGMIFLFLIILVLAVFSGYYLNRLSGKTSAILKENYLSVVYSRDMNEDVMNINKELTTSFIKKIPPDTVRITEALNHFSKSLADARNNITEPGEDKLVADIEKGYLAYRESVLSNMNSGRSAEAMGFLQNKAGTLDQLLLLLSQINGKAIEVKTDDAKTFSYRALTHMTILATICFLIGMSYTFSFASYFNQRIYQLHNGIKQIVASNFNQHLFFEGRRDEFYEISVVFNEMADKLKENERKLALTLPSGTEKKLSNAELEELKKMLSRMRSIEEEAAGLISRFDKK
jgi:nitrate/nitrite-specific signal transduction histidine kinase